MEGDRAHPVGRRAGDAASDSCDCSTHNVLVGHGGKWGGQSCWGIAGLGGDFVVIEPRCVCVAGEPPTRPMDPLIHASLGARQPRSPCTLRGWLTYRRYERDGSHLRFLLPSAPDGGGAGTLRRLLGWARAEVCGQGSLRPPRCSVAPSARSTPRASLSGLQAALSTSLTPAGQQGVAGISDYQVRNSGTREPPNATEGKESASTPTTLAANARALRRSIGSWGSRSVTYAFLWRVDWTPNFLVSQIGFMQSAGDTGRCGTAKHPAIQVRFSRFRGTVQQGPVQRQEAQIVQSGK